MALSGSTSKIYSSKNSFWVWVEWTATQNIANNTSTITAITYGGTNSYGYYTGSNNGSSVTVNGVTAPVGDSGDVSANTTKRELCRNTVTVEHNSDGSKSVTISGRWWYNGSIVFDMTSSGTFTLDTIARASIPTLSTSTQAIGSAITIYTNKKSDSFSHRVYSDFYDGFWTRLDTQGVIDSFTWTIPTGFASKIPSATSGSGRIAVETYNGSTLVGTNIVNFTATVPDTTAYQPSIGNLTVAIAGTGRDKTIGKYVQGISKATMSFTSSSNGGASIVSNTINIKRQSDGGNSMTYSKTSETSGTLMLVGTYLITATTTDSRGRSKSITTTIDVDAYSVPKISNFTATRQATTRVNVDTVREGTYTYLGGSNPLTVTIAKRPRGGSYTNINTSAGLTNGTFSGTYVSKYVLNVDTDNSETISYDFKLTISDSFGNSAVAEITVPTSSVALSINGDIGIGVGKIHEQGALDVNGEAFLNGNPIATTNLAQMFKLTTDDGFPKPASSDLNSLTEVGSHIFGASSLNRPDNYGVINVVRRTSQHIMQTAHSTGNRVFTRFTSDGGANWTAWAESITTSNISTIMSWGVNANGKYIKYADGTMIAFNRVVYNSHNITASWGSWFISSADLTLTLPIAFYDNPVISVHMENSSGDIATWMNSTVTSTNFKGRFARGQSATVNAIVGWTAIGRWK